MHRRILLSSFALALFVAATISHAEPAEAAAPAPEATAPSGAIPVIEQLHGDFLDVMKRADEIGYDGRYRELQTIVGDSFDLPFMAEKSVGRHWKKLGPEEQERWVRSFQELTAATYAGRFEGYSGQSFEILGEESARSDTVMVKAHILDPGNENVSINYRLREADGEWRVIDVYLNGTVSELALRRSEYSSVLKRDGFEKLIETIDGKTDEIADASVN